jgi:hypothetical protein
MTTLYDLSSELIQVLLQVLDPTSLLNFSLTSRYFRGVIVVDPKSEEFKRTRLASVKANLLLTLFANMTGIPAYATHVVPLCQLANKFNACLDVEYPKIPKETNFKQFVASHPEFQLTRRGEWLVSTKGTELVLRPFSWNFMVQKTKIINYVPSSLQKGQEGSKKRKCTMINGCSKRRRHH